MYHEDIRLNKDERKIQEGPEVKTGIQKNSNLGIYKSIFRKCGQIFISEIQS